MLKIIFMIIISLNSLFSWELIEVSQDLKTGKIDKNIQYCVKQCQDIARQKDLFQEANKKLESQINEKDQIINDLTQSLHDCQEELKSLKIKFNKIVE